MSTSSFFLIIEHNLAKFSVMMLVTFCCHLAVHMMRHKAIMWKHDVTRKTGSTYCIAVPSEEDQAIWKIWWWLAMHFSSYMSRQTDRQLNRHTNHNTLHPPESKVKTVANKWRVMLIICVDFICVEFSAVSCSEHSASCRRWQQHSQVVMETTSASCAQWPSHWISGIFTLLVIFTKCFRVLESNCCWSTFINWNLNTCAGFYI